MKISKSGVMVLVLIFIFQLILPVGCLVYEKNAQRVLEERGEEFRIPIGYLRISDGEVHFGISDLLVDMYDESNYTGKGYISFSTDKDGLGHITYSKKKPAGTAYMSVRKMEVLDNNDFFWTYEPQNKQVEDFKSVYICDFEDYHLSGFEKEGPPVLVVKVYKNRIVKTNLELCGVSFDDFVDKYYQKLKENDTGYPDDEEVYGYDIDDDYQYDAQFA